MKKKIAQVLEPVTWFCKRCGQQNGNTYKCDGMYQQKDGRGNIFYLGCRNTPIHNRMVSKYCWSKDKRRKHFDAANYRQYVERYA